MLQVILKCILTLIILIIAYFAIHRTWTNSIDILSWLRKPADMIPVEGQIKDLPSSENIQQQILEENKKQTDLLEKMQRISETDHGKLMQEYPLGYILFAIKDKHEIIGKQSQQEWEIDWNSARILALDEKQILFILPNMRSNDGKRELGSNTVAISKEKGIALVIRAFGVVVLNVLLV
jgi:hypothetical protein